jgi:hypothetical protein
MSGSAKIPGDQRGDRDSHLRAGELKRQRAVGPLDEPIAPPSGAGVGVYSAAFQRRQRELRSHEQRGPGGERYERHQLK